MLAEKRMQFRKRNKDLQTLGVRILESLESHGFEAQMNNQREAVVIQAAKGSIPRELLPEGMAFSIMVCGKPNDFSIRIGIGRLLDDLGVTEPEKLEMSNFFLAQDVPETLWGKVVGERMAREMAELAGGESRPVGGMEASNGHHERARQSRVHRHRRALLGRSLA